MKPGADARIARGAGQFDAGERRRLLHGITDLRFDAVGWLAALADPGLAGVTAAILPMAPVAPVAPPAPDITGLDLIRALTQDAVFQLK